MRQKDIDTLNSIFNIEPDKRTKQQRKLFKGLLQEWEQEQEEKEYKSWVNNQPV